MPRWLERASKTVAGDSPETPQSYEVVCTCGNTYQGYRQPHAQELICELCGEPLFILPVDLYPRPRPRPAPRKNRKAASKPAPRAPRVPLGRRLAATVQALGGRVQQSARSLALRVRSLFTPLRAVVVLLVLVLAGTAWLALRAKERDRAELTLRDAAERGAAALEKRDFGAAAAEFGAAVAALDILGRDDVHARRLRQRHRESLAMGNLATLSLYEIAHEARDGRRGSDAAWDDYFRTHYAGQWVVIDTTIERARRGTDAGTLLVHYPLALGSTPVALRIDPAVFDGVPLDRGPARVIFAAQLAGCRMVSSPSPRWEIRLRGETAFLWTDPALYAELGFEPDDLDPEDETRDVLDAQARRAGVE